jgi:hypothetical protein
MQGRDLTRLRAWRDEARNISKRLDSATFQHPRISLPIGEAIQAAARLEAFLADVIDTVEAELYRGPRPKE